MLYCALYFLQLGRANTQRFLEARRRLAEKLPFMGSRKACFVLAIGLLLFVLFRIAELIHTVYGPF
jgi:hypothetical protein